MARCPYTGVRMTARRRFGGARANQVQQLSNRCSASARDRLVGSTQGSTSPKPTLLYSNRVPCLSGVQVST